MFEFVSFYGSCFEIMRSLLIEKLLYNISITINAIPMYYLQPNRMIYLNEPKIGLNGYFIIDSISYTLTHDSMATITAHQAEIVA